MQSPQGGTKISWGGPPVTPQVATTKQRFELTPTEGSLGNEAARLIALGATRLAVGGAGDSLLADPDGNEFRLLAFDGVTSRPLCHVPCGA